MNLVEVPLHRLAHARSGDKGERLNIALIAWVPAHLPLLAEQLSEARVLALFRHRGASRVRRYLLARLGAMNFVIDTVLEGGVNQSLGLDGHGKSLSYLLLATTLRVPDTALSEAAAAIAAENAPWT
ncbi:MAG: hypothetical protein IT556_03805 [Acetobacteraceae bacterium]|nr:hypothetical protein [Acetobacteraceae bacterium]